MTLKGQCRNPVYINFTEGIVNDAEKCIMREGLYRMTQTVLKELAKYPDEKILIIMDNIRRSEFQPRHRRCNSLKEQKKYSI